MSRIVDEYRLDLKDQGFWYRMTEWYGGTQVCVYHKSNPYKNCIVSSWKSSEEEALLEIFPRTQEILQELKKAQTPEKKETGE